MDARELARSARTTAAWTACEQAADYWFALAERVELEPEIVDGLLRGGGGPAANQPADQRAHEKRRKNEQQYGRIHDRFSKNIIGT